MWGCPWLSDAWPWGEQGRQRVGLSVEPDTGGGWECGFWIGWSA